MESENLPKLTQQQQNFLLRYFSNGKNASEAYRYAYNTKKMQSSSVWVEASKLLKNPKVTLWVEYYEANQKETIQEEVNYTAQQAFNELDELLIIALEGQGKLKDPNVSAATKIVELKNRLVGNFEKDNQQKSVQINTMGTVLVDDKPLELKVGQEVETYETE